MNMKALKLKVELKILNPEINKNDFTKLPAGGFIFLSKTGWGLAANFRLILQFLQTYRNIYLRQNLGI